MINFITSHRRNFITDETFDQRNLQPTKFIVQWQYYTVLYTCFYYPGFTSIGPFKVIYLI